MESCALQECRQVELFTTWRLNLVGLKPPACQGKHHELPVRPWHNVALGGEEDQVVGFEQRDERASWKLEQVFSSGQLVHIIDEELVHRFSYQLAVDGHPQVGHLDAVVDVDIVTDHHCTVLYKAIHA